MAIYSKVLGKISDPPTNIVGAVNLDLKQPSVRSLNHDRGGNGDGWDIDENQ